MKEHNIIKILSKLGVDESDIHPRDAGEGQRWVNTPCIFAPYLHDGGTDSSPSFGISVNEEGASNGYCYTCGKKGHLHNLILQLEHYSGDDMRDVIFDSMLAEQDVTPPGVDEIRARRRKRANEKEVPMDETGFTIMAHVLDNRYTPRIARQYLARRGMTKRGVKLMEARWDDYDSRVVVPVRDQKGVLYGMAGRTILAKKDYPERFNEKGKPKNFPKVKNYYGLKKENHILGMHLWEADKPVFIHEGIAGQMYLLSIGADKYFNVGAIMGSKISTRQVSLLAQFGSPVYLMLDNDKAGDVGLYGELDEDGETHKGGGAIDMLKNHVPVKVPAWPEGKDDPDQLTIEEIKSFLDMV